MNDVESREHWEGRLNRWLADTVGPRPVDGARQDFQIFHDLDEDDLPALDRLRDYCRARYDAGFGATTLPVEHGGAGLPASYAVRLAQIEQHYDVPSSTELISVTTRLVAPGVALFGTDRQRERFLRPLLRTDLLACQLFSEPGAGSDLASLSCRATRAERGSWRVNGQKVWTSGAQFADLGLLLARTNPDAPKHAGISVFLLPLDSPGVTIRPIRQMSGGSAFCEVFLDDVEVPDDLRLGDVDAGWTVATAILAFERQASGAGTRRTGGTVDDLVKLARSTDASTDPAIRERLADVYVLATLRSATADRVARAAAAGAAPGPAASVGKLVGSDLLVSIGELAADLLGPSIMADTDDGGFAWSAHLLGAPGYRLAGGTDQIQRNIIAERVLGLPREPRVDIPHSRADSNS